MIRRCLVLVFFLYSVSFVRADTYNEVAGSGLFINSVPPGATVFIDGVERGSTPFNLPVMRSGEYSIRVVREGYEERRFSVVIRQNSRVEVSVDLEEIRGQVLLELRRDPDAPASLPFSPRISVDGTRLPSSGFVTASAYEQHFSLPAGWRTITVEAFGWERVITRIFVEETSSQKIELILKPAAFSLTNEALRKKRFNPLNSGTLGKAEIIFTVSAPGRGLLEVFDSQGTLIHTEALGPFNAWQQQAAWDGRNSSGVLVGDGLYTLRINAWKDETEEMQSVELMVQVDSSQIMRPLSLASSSAGLLFVPSPEALPAFSYQIEGNFLGGKPLLHEAGKSLPFAVGFRISFLDRLEAAAAFTINPGLSLDTNWGIGASLKWIFFRPRNNRDEDHRFIDALGMAAELSYGWASAGPYTAFGMGTGLGLRLPLMYRFLNGETARSGAYSLDLLLSPQILWAGDKGYPDSMVPRLGMGGGVFFGYGSIATGVSLRWDYDTEAQSSGPLATALELKFFPSNFVFSVIGGFWYLPDGKKTGIFAGAGLGIMH